MYALEEVSDRWVARTRTVVELLGYGPQANAPSAMVDAYPPAKPPTAEG